jgi:hypothetical protein
MIYKNKNNTLNCTKNETKFRQFPSNWVHKQNMISCINELVAIIKNHRNKLY